MTAASDRTSFLPVPVTALELTDLDARPRTNARGEISLLVTLHGIPLGVLDLLGGDGSEPDLRARALEQFGPAALRHLRQDGVVGPGPTDLENLRPACPQRPEPAEQLVSVVICTLGEDPRVASAVTSVLAQTGVELELVVVDNRPSSGGVRRLLAGFADDRLRVVDEPRPGLSAARNAGLRAARGEFVAFTDDDAFVAPDWAARLVAPFALDRSVVCTTGLVLPAELATPAQVWFEEFGAFDKGFERTVWSMRPLSASLAAAGRLGEGGVLFPYSAGVYGSGNNMAFRADWLGSQKLFDEALGAGSATRGGEDLDAFLAVMLDGQVLVYEPAAVVRHHARTDMPALRGQMYGYGSGMAAVVVKHALRPRQALGIVRRVPAGLRKLLAADSDKNASRSAAFPVELSRAELRGYLAGPLLYARARRVARRQGTADRPSSQLGPLPPGAR